jgi:hypothetical protein
MRRSAHAEVPRSRSDSAEIHKRVSGARFTSAMPQFGLGRECHYNFREIWDYLIAMPCLPACGILFLLELAVYPDGYAFSCVSAAAESRRFVRV